MRTIFEKLKKISAEYRENVDSLAQDWELDGRRDYLYSDAVKAEKVTERNSRFNTEIDKAAQEAVEKAESEIGKLRGAMRKYITSSDDAGTLAAVQALVSAGVELSAAELAAFSEKGGFAARKLLEKHTSGMVKPLSVESLEGDLKELEVYFRDIVCYRGKLAEASTSTPWGQPASVGSKIQEGRIEHFPEKLGEMQARWSALDRMS